MDSESSSQEFLQVKLEELAQQEEKEEGLGLDGLEQHRGQQQRQRETLLPQAHPLAHRDAAPRLPQPQVGRQPGGKAHAKVPVAPQPQAGL